MAKYSIDGDTLNGLAQAIQELNGIDRTMTASSMADWVYNKITQDMAFYSGESTVFYNPYLTKIGANTFYAEQVATEINLPNVTEIGAYGIYSCSNLTKVNLPKVVSTTTYSLGLNSKLTELNLPSLEVVGESTLRKLTALANINIPKARVIKGYAMRGCTSLERIILPSIESFGGMPFADCTALKEIIITNEKTLPVVSNGLFTFAEENWDNYPNFQSVYVPDELVSTYTSSTNWSRYWNFIKPLSEWEGAE